MAYTIKATGRPSIPPLVVGNTTTRKFRLGTVVEDEAGNQYRYVKANEALAVGEVVTPVARAAWDSGILVDGAASSGDTKIHVDTITTAVAADYYAGYWISQATASGLGKSYRIKSHGALAASGEADIFLEDALQEAFANNAPLFIYNPFLVEKIDATTEVACGVAIDTIASGSYGFVQTGGYCQAVKVGHSTSAAIVINEPLVPVGTGVEGAMQGFAAGTPNEAEILTGVCSRIFSLQAVNANTTGFVGARLVGL